MSGEKDSCVVVLSGDFSHFLFLILVALRSERHDRAHEIAYNVRCGIVSIDLKFVFPSFTALFYDYSHGGNHLLESRKA